MDQEKRVDPSPRPPVWVWKTIIMSCNTKKLNHVKRVRVFCEIPFCDGTRSNKHCGHRRVSFSYRPDVMNLLEIVENHLGEFYHWPSFVLLFLFEDHPSPVRTGRLRKVILFLYGNDVPKDLAYQFYIVCSGKASKFVLEQFNECYHVWHTHRCEPHMAEYWNMRLRKFIYINDSLLNQSEPVLPEVTTIDFGIDITGLSRRIHNRLELVRQIKV